MKLAPLVLLAALVVVGCTQAQPEVQLPYGPQATITPELAAKSPVEIPGAVIRGSPSGPVLIVEYSDYECPYCAEAAKRMKEVLAAYPDKVGFVLKHRVLSSIHPQAPKAAEAFECAKEQGFAWQMHDKIYANQKDLSVQGLKEEARSINGISTQRFDECLDTGSKQGIVTSDNQEAASLGIMEIPTLFINNKMLRGATTIEALKKVIDAELAGNQTAGAA
jgi:protein-disulfide isomerase